MNIQDTDIAQIISSIWTSVLGLECEQTNDLPGANATIMACIQITGGWNGAVVLGCPETLARTAAAVMFGLNTEQTTHTDMQDALAELTNMIGGNLKGLLPVSDACHLSLPAIVSGADYTTRVPGSRSLHRVVMNCGGHFIVVNVLEKLPASKAA